MNCEFRIHNYRFNPYFHQGYIVNDTIRVIGLKFAAKHGVLPEEKNLIQCSGRFIVMSLRMLCRTGPKRGTETVKLKASRCGIR